MENYWEQTISMHFVRVLKKISDANGLNDQLMLQQGSIKPEHVDIEDARITAAQLAGAMENIWSQSQDELMYLGSAKIPRGCFAMAAKYTIPAGNLTEALYRFSKFYASVTDSFTFNFHDDPNNPSLAISLQDDSKDKDHLLTELTLLMAHRFVGWLIGQFISLKRAEFNYSEPKHSKEYQLMYACPCEFNKKESRLFLDPDLLNKPLVQSKESLAGYLQRIPTNWFKRQIFHQQTASMVVRALHKAPQFKNTQISDVANSMNVTDRTLRRRLIREGTSFQTIKDTYRRDRAIELLAKTNLTVNQIASEVGFTEPNAFSRAFKKWTGSNPQSYRI